MSECTCKGCGARADRLSAGSSGEYVLHDHPAFGGDGTYYTGCVVGVPWGPRVWARVMSAGELLDALEECDQARLLRHRLCWERV